MNKQSVLIAAVAVVTLFSASGAFAAGSSVGPIIKMHGMNRANDPASGTLILRNAASISGTPACTTATQE